MFNERLRAIATLAFRTMSDVAGADADRYGYHLLASAISEEDISVSNMALALLPAGAKYDTAIPQDWVNQVIKALGPENSPVGHFVFCYHPVRDLIGNGGYPYPITEKGRVMAGILSGMIDL